MNFSTYLNVKSVGWSYLAPSGAFLPFVKFIKVFDEKYFVSRNPNKEIVLFWTKV